MNIFGIGLPEMGIIAVVALLIFGPEKLPEVMGQAGKLLKDFRGMTSNLTGEFEKTIAEAKEIGNSLTGELGGMSKQVNSITNSVKQDLNKATSTPAKSGTLASASAPKSNTAKKSTTSTSTSSTSKASSTSTTAVVSGPVKASKEDPVLDISLYEPTPIERKSRTRRATPAAIGDRTPRVAITSLTDAQAEAEDARLNGDISVVTTDDAIQRARARRRNAGYSRQSA